MFQEYQSLGGPVGVVRLFLYLAISKNKKMEIIHDIDNRLAKTIVEGSEAYVSYTIENGELDIRHTIVPRAIEGRGIAAQLVKFVYDYALKNGLRPVGTCSYADVWLRRHPEYCGKTGKDYSGPNSCAL